MSQELHQRWRSHLCGLCLALRDTAGQSARVLTGYDVLMVPVLIEAQAGRAPTHTAGPCPLRGFRTAQVVSSDTRAMETGTAVALLAGGAGLRDKVADGDLPSLLTPAATRIARRFVGKGSAAAERSGLDGQPVIAAPALAKDAETAPGATLDDLLAPAGAAVATIFAHTATVAGTTDNAPELRRIGDAFGRLVHLVDAIEDHESDERHGRFNPLAATTTTPREAGALAQSLHAAIRHSLDQLELVDGELARELLGPTLARVVERVTPREQRCELAPSPRRHAGVAVALATFAAAQAAVFGGGRRRRGPYDPYGNDPYSYGRPGYGYPPYGRRRGGCGPSCGQMLACDCCGNCLCDSCCGGDSFCCCI